MVGYRERGEIHTVTERRRRRGVVVSKNLGSSSMGVASLVENAVQVAVADRYTYLGRGGCRVVDLSSFGGVMSSMLLLKEE